MEQHLRKRLDTDNVGMNLQHPPRTSPLGLGPDFTAKLVQFLGKLYTATLVGQTIRRILRPWDPTDVDLPTCD